MKKTLAAALLSSSLLAQAEPIVFDTKAMSMTLPDVTVGSSSYKLVLHYDSDGRLSITSLTPNAAAGSSCTLNFEDTKGKMSLKFAKVTRDGKQYFKMIGQVTSGTPFFCASNVAVVQNNRQLDSNVFMLRADASGPDAGYASCAVFQANTQTILYVPVSDITSSAPWFNPSAKFDITYTPVGTAPSTISCTP